MNPQNDPIKMNRNVVAAKLRLRKVKEREIRGFYGLLIVVLAVVVAVGTNMDGSQNI